MELSGMSSEQSNVRYSAKDLISFARQLLERSGMAAGCASVVAEILVEGDLLGHSTHGLQMLTAYLKSIKSGGMKTSGEPATVSDNGSAVVWDGGYLPGPWLVIQALNLCLARVAANPVMTLVIRKCHHIACLAAYLRRATERGLLMILSCSNPSARNVAPFGGITPVFTPNPLAVGIPTEREPILIDISMSCTAMKIVDRCIAKGEMLPHAWVMDNAGNVSDDPQKLYTDPPGTVLPLGGPDLGYKGFALALMIEALTSALGGFGRADEPNQWGSSVFLQVIDPNAFGGIRAFRRETEWLAEACRRSEPRSGGPGIRVPGDLALERRTEQIAHGLLLYPTILPDLRPWADKLEVPFPEPVSVD